MLNLDLIKESDFIRVAGNLVIKFALVINIVREFIMMNELKVSNHMLKLTD